jgi:hypothetical protein
MKFIGISAIISIVALKVTVEAACSPAYGQCGGKSSFFFYTSLFFVLINFFITKL